MTCLDVTIRVGGCSRRGWPHAEAYGEEMNIEMLDLSSTILSHPKDYLQPRRQELVQFGWYHLKNEESTARPHAFRNVTSFLQNFDVPPKLVVQVPTRPCLQSVINKAC